MPFASIFLRPTPSYRPEVFTAGLRRMGFDIQPRYRQHPDPSDVLLIWNRNRSFESLAALYERHGARVIIAENGYLPTTAGEKKLFALALGQHNGAGSWYVGAEARQEFALSPWRESGSHILLLPQRGIGARGVAMPSGWLDSTRRRLAEITDRPIRIRKHPGAAKSDPWPDLRGAHCAITWGSGAGIKAIAAGIPVFCGLRSWIGAPAARCGLDDIEDCYLGDRAAMLRPLSWAQWRVEEVESGEAFSYLLNA